MQKDLPYEDIIDVNMATAEQLRAIFHIGEATAKKIIGQRPYRGWEDFRENNPGFSEAELTALQNSGVVIGGMETTRLKR